MEELLVVRPDSLDRFLIRWYGPPARPAGATTRLDEMPLPLQHLHRLTNRWDRPLFAQNQLANPLKVDQGKVVFYVENQGVWLWGFERGTDDPEIWDRENESDCSWELTGVPLSAFLLQAAAFEAVFGASVGATAIDIRGEQLQAALAPLQAIPLPAWRWPGPESRLYCGDGLLAFAGVNDRPGSPVGADSLWQIFVAATDPAALAYLDELPIEWERYTPA